MDACVYIGLFFLIVYCSIPVVTSTTDGNWRIRSRSFYFNILLLITPTSRNWRQRSKRCDSNLLIFILFLTIEGQFHSGPLKFWLNLSENGGWCLPVCRR